MRVRRSHSLSALAVGAALVFPLTLDAFGTWSIVAVDRRTREVCIGTATCIVNGHIERAVPVVVPGVGAAAAQSFVSANRRERVYQGLVAQLTPGEILEFALDGDVGMDDRQYGIVNLVGPPVSFTGAGDGPWAGGVSGFLGGINYAIQGNVLTGQPVIDAAEAAFLTTDGDLGQRVMAAMEAAASFGGDGRCSCNGPAADSCGSPPPSFTKSAHTGVIVISRPGDVDGGCTDSGGCLLGQYYMRRLANGGWSDPDPVLELREKYDMWRLNRVGKPDHLTSEIIRSATRAVADGVTLIDVTIQLRDIEGDALTVGGQSVAIESVGSGPLVAIAGPVTDNNDGTHSFSLQTTTNSGPGEWKITVTQLNTVAQLSPNLRVQVDPLRELHAGVVRVLASGATEVPLVLNLGAAAAGRPYQILASAAGTQPGTPFGGQIIPLNADRLFNWTLAFPGNAAFPGSSGALDGSGRAQARLRLPALGLEPLIGTRLDFVALLPLPAGADLTNGVAVEVLP